MPTTPPPEDQLEAEDIVVTGSRTAPLTTASPAPLPSYLTIARPIPTPTRPEPEQDVIIVDFEWGLLGIKTIVVETKEGPVKIKIDKGNMSDAQFGALIKAFQNFESSPKLQDAMEKIAKVDKDRVNSEIFISFQYGNKFAEWNKQSESFELKVWEDSLHKGQASAGKMPNGDTLIILSISNTQSGLYDFVQTALHEFYHAYAGITGAPNDEVRPDQFALAVIDQFGRGFFRDSADYAHQKIVLGSDSGDTLNGSDGRDNISGAAGNDVIIGGAGGDALVGDDGNDLLEGGSGQDILIGGGHSNTMRGGLDADTYISAAESTGDVIVEEGGIDLLDLSHLSSASVHVVRDGNDLLLNSVRIVNHFTDAGRVEQFVFEDGIFAASFVEQKAYGGGGGGVCYHNGEWVLCDGSSHGMPVVLDLDGDGIELTAPHRSWARFDMNGDGKLDQIGWVGRDDGILFLDRNGNGVVDSFSEISFVQDFRGAGTDFEGLYAFDSDRDGFLTAYDDRFAEFQIWIDRNGNGRSEKHELFTLGELGIVSIGLEAFGRSPLDPARHENQLLGQSVFQRADGSSGLVGDVALYILDHEAHSVPPSGHSGGSEFRMMSLNAEIIL